MFLVLIMFLCWIVVAVFMNVIASLFVTYPETVLPVNIEIPLAAIMGFSVHFAKQRHPPARVKALVGVLSVVMLLLLYFFVWVGKHVEDSGAVWVNGKNVDPVFGFALHEGAGTNYTVTRQLCRDAVNYNRNEAGPVEATCGFGAIQFWTLYLTVYALIVSVLPVWVVLQPRDFINSHQLKACMLLLLIGLVIKSPSLDGPAFRSSVGGVNEDGGFAVFPMLFTTIACGSVSGFHGLVSSGVTSKQVCCAMAVPLCIVWEQFGA